MFSEVYEWGSSLSWWQHVLLGLGLFAVTFVVSLVAVGIFLVKIPPTFFLENHNREWGHGGPRWLYWAGKIGKNLLGVVLVILGVIQLFMPGQGLITILIGVVLLDFPGKRALERRIISRPKVLSAVNHLRARYNRPPLVLE